MSYYINQILEIEYNPIILSNDINYLNKKFNEEFFFEKY